MTAKPNLHMMGIHRVMAGININQVQKEFDIVFDFIYNKNIGRGEPPVSWDDYCKTFRGGAQDLAELSKLISSLCDTQPWRFIVTRNDITALAAAGTTVEEAAKSMMNCDEVSE